MKTKIFIASIFMIGLISITTIAQNTNYEIQISKGWNLIPTPVFIFGFSGFPQQDTHETTCKFDMDLDANKVWFYDAVNKRYLNLQEARSTNYLDDSEHATFQAF